MSERREIGRRQLARKSTMTSKDAPITRSKSRHPSPSHSEPISRPIESGDTVEQPREPQDAAPQPDSGSEIEVFNVAVCEKENGKRPLEGGDPDTDLPSPPRRVQATTSSEPACTMGSIAVEGPVGGPALTEEQIQRVIDLLKAKDMYTRLGSNSITGALAIVWNSSKTIPGPSPWFTNLGVMLATAGSNIALTAQLNLVFDYHFYTAIAGNNQRCLERLVTIVLARERTANVGDYKIGFRTKRMARPPLSEVFANFYKGSTIDTSAVQAELMICLEISRRLAQTIVPAIALGLSASDNVSYYGVCWLLYFHRVIYLINDMVPVYTNIANDAMEWIDIDADDNQVANVSQRLLAAIANYRMIILANYFTIGEIAILRLVANGLPRFAAAAAAVRVMLLDDTHTPKIPLIVLGRGAMPDLPVEVPTALQIQGTILKLARLNSEETACYSGLIRACCTAMRFRRLENNNTIVDGFCQHRRSTWILPTFMNPLIRWLNLCNVEESGTAYADMEHFILGPAEDQVLRAIATSCITSVATSTILHRWSIPANTLQAYYNRTGRLEFGAALNYLGRVLGATMGSSTCPLLSNVCNLIGDLCHVHLPAGAFAIPLWSDVEGDRIDPIAADSGWLAGWPRRIPYPVEPQAVLWMFQRWPDVWGFMAQPIILSVDKEICSLSLVGESPVCITRGDDLLAAAAQSGKWYPSSGYTTAVINALSQHCLVPEWQAPACFLVGRDNSNYQPLLEADIVPAFEYDDEALLFVVGSIWHYCWRQQLVIGVQWQRQQLSRLVQQIFSRRQTISLNAGIESAAVADIISGVQEAGFEEEVYEL